ncbi:MAG: hypothetical protein MI861_22770 [Pirellulales bacterium]|nr:hypothetical protein [Pirellulales bacterium]
MSRIKQLLREDPVARRELAELERSLKPLEEGYEAVDPPPADLVSRTMANLPPLPDLPGQVPNLPGQVPATAEKQAPATAEKVESSSGALIPMQCVVEAPKNAAMAWTDWASGAVAAAMLLGLLLPTVAHERFRARKTACQDKLRELGTELTEFVNRNQQSRLPAVSESGPEAFAGVYAVRLYEAGLLDDPFLRWCPSVDPPDLDELTLISPEEMVTTSDLRQASVDRLRQIQRFIGGHYAYTLGVIEQDHLAPPRFESRSSFAVMSDAPMVGLPGGRLGADRIGHGGIGINVLYEDGRVQFLTLSSLESIPDHPLLNHRGRAEAGVNIDDASLAPSWRPPFIDVQQR